MRKVYTVSITVKDVADVWGVKNHKRTTYYGKSDMSTEIDMVAENIDRVIEVAENYVREEFGEDAKIGYMEITYDEDESDSKITSIA